MIRLEDKGREYKRYRHTNEEKLFLGTKGFRSVLSSNVSAVSVKGENLVIRFHNGSIYEYFDVARYYDDILKSNSKGKFVWNRLRRASIPYSKFSHDEVDNIFEKRDEGGLNILKPDMLTLDDIPVIYNMLTSDNISKNYFLSNIYSSIITNNNSTMSITAV